VEPDYRRQQQPGLLPFVQRDILRRRRELAGDASHYDVIVAGIEQDERRASLRPGGVGEWKLQ
jgi:hypothetical protein